jgi:hypothetical protein
MACATSVDISTAILVPHGRLTILFPLVRAVGFVTCRTSGRCVRILAIERKRRNCDDVLHKPAGYNFPLNWSLHNDHHR